MCLKNAEVTGKEAYEAEFWTLDYNCIHPNRIQPFLTGFRL